MRSHTGEKPYKCELCAYHSNYGSNLSRHRRRKHNLLPLTHPTVALRSMTMWETLQSKSNVGDGKQRMLIALGLPSMVTQKPDYLSDFTHKMQDLQSDFHDRSDRTFCGLQRDPQELLLVDNPLNQRSALVGHLSCLSSENQNPVSADVDSSLEEKPCVTQKPFAQGGILRSSPVGLKPPPPSLCQRDCSPLAGPSSPSFGSSQLSTPALT